MENPRMEHESDDRIVESMGRQSSQSQSSSTTSSSLDGAAYTESSLDRIGYADNMFRKHREMIHEFKRKYRESVRCITRAGRCNSTFPQLPIVPSSSTPTPIGFDSPKYLVLAEPDRIWKRESSLRALINVDDDDFHLQQPPKDCMDQMREHEVTPCTSTEQDTQFLDTFPIDMTLMDDSVFDDEAFYDCLPIPETTSQEDEDQHEQKSILEATAQKYLAENTLLGRDCSESSLQPSFSFQEEPDPSIRQVDYLSDGPPHPSMDDSEQKMLDQFLASVGSSEDTKLLSLADLHPYETSHIQQTQQVSEQEVSIEEITEHGQDSVSDVYDAVYAEKTEHDEVDDIMDYLFETMDSIDNDSRVSNSPKIDDSTPNGSRDSGNYISSDSDSDGTCSGTKSFLADEIYHIDVFGEADSRSRNTQTDADDALNEFLAMMDSMGDDESAADNSEMAQVASVDAPLPQSVVISTSSRSSATEERVESSSCTSSDTEDGQESDSQYNVEDSSSGERSGAFSPEDDMDSDPNRNVETADVASSVVLSPISSDLLVGIDENAQVNSAMTAGRGKSDDGNLSDILARLDEISANASQKNEKAAEHQEEKDDIPDEVELGDPKPAVGTTATAVCTDSMTIYPPKQEASVEGDKDALASSTLFVVGLLTKSLVKLDTSSRIMMGGQESVFTCSVPHVVSSTEVHENAPGMSRQPSRDKNRDPDYKTDIRFAPLPEMRPESKSRITSPDLNTSTSVLEGPRIKFLVRDSGRPIDPVANALSLESQNQKEDVDHEHATVQIGAILRSTESKPRPCTADDINRELTHPSGILDESRDIRPNKVTTYQRTDTYDFKDVRTHVPRDVQEELNGRNEMYVLYAERIGNTYASNADAVPLKFPGNKEPVSNDEKTTASCGTQDKSNSEIKEQLLLAGISGPTCDAVECEASTLFARINSDRENVFGQDGGPNCACDEDDEMQYLSVDRMGAPSDAGDRDETTVSMEVRDDLQSIDEQEEKKSPIQACQSLPVVEDTAKTPESTKEHGPVDDRPETIIPCAIQDILETITQNTERLESHCESVEVLQDLLLTKCFTKESSIPLSPPRPNRHLELEQLAARFDETSSYFKSPDYGVPSFDQDSVSTISAALASTNTQPIQSFDTADQSDLSIITLGVRNERRNDLPSNAETFEEVCLKPNIEVRKTKAVAHHDRPSSKSSTPVRVNKIIPFSKTNQRMDNYNRHHNHEPCTPHLVPSSRSPFRQESMSGIRSLFSPGDKSTLQSLRSYYSLASPPRTPGSPQASSVPRTPRDTTNGNSPIPQSLSPAMAATPKSPYHQAIAVCTNKFVYNLHSELGPCNRCWALASLDEQQRFLERGSHLRILRTKGGCDSSCTIFPPKHDRERPVRLCRQCFFATHQIDVRARLHVYRGNHIKVKVPS